ncbi:MAG TPA: cytochrome c oxidase subunit 3 [Saprospiraceae bacterium]|nr:cytochrome c oxidase subunit 3 [Saprospiraceae bacterium]HND87021.1 cytochrome c oxidase subunit 3 [Saprospiraceae bacterium]HNG91111.1 cytochrome c oxidase subunit 3 [Saprospiraceae bacterium]
MDTSSDRRFLYPPGGILIWLIISVELVTFGAGLVVFGWQRSHALQEFSASRRLLDPSIGFANTLILLTSGFLLAEAVHKLRSGATAQSRWRVWAALALGLAFLLLKSSEYAAKLAQGLDLGYSPFFTFYWLLTGFHFFHVLTGVVILAVLALKIGRGAYHAANTQDVETGAAFWHLCDLIWLLLFPILYLLP